MSDRLEAVERGRMEAEKAAAESDARCRRLEAEAAERAPHWNELATEKTRLEQVRLHCKFTAMECGTDECFGTGRGAVDYGPAGVPATTRAAGADGAAEAPRVGHLPQRSPALGQNLRRFAGAQSKRKPVEAKQSSYSLACSKLDKLLIEAS